MVFSIFRKKDKNSDLDKELYTQLTELNRIGERIDVTQAIDEETANILNSLLLNISNLLEKKFQNTKDKFYSDAREAFVFFLNSQASKLPPRKKQGLWDILIKKIPQIINKIQGYE